MKLRLLPRAIRDIQELNGYISRRDAKAAGVVARIAKALRTIESNPFVGRPVEGRAVREWSVHGLPLVIPYRIETDAIEVLRVYHTRRKRPTQWS
jgi:plasmid stabilization system protein ParE